jgi:lysophospholipase L1-like esterase
MKRLLVTTVFGYVLILSSPMLLAGSGPPNSLSEEEKQAGWRLLFDGKTTSGWRGYRMEAMPRGWKVLDGALVRISGGAGGKGAGGGDDIITIEQFDNFELQLEWRIVAGGNSGVLYRVTEDAETSWHVAPEMQVLDNTAHPNRDKRQLAGSLYDLYAPTKDVTHRPGEWNQAKVVANGNHVEHWLNGEKIVEYELRSADWKQRIAHSKFKDMPKFAQQLKGHICLQDHSDRVEFRSIKIRPLHTAHAGAGEFFFKDGDVVVMIGDSITEQHLYSNYVEMWTVTRFPGWKLTFRNVGIGGDRSPGGNSRFKRDVLAHQPTAMTVDFGMNDGGYGGFRDDLFKAYLDGLEGMAQQAKSAGVRVAWITPQPLDTGEQGATALTGYNQTLERFSEGVRKVAERSSAVFVDQFHPYLQVLDKARAASSTYERITAGDAVHPGPPGQALMAASILKGLDFPTLVSSAEIDAASERVTAAHNCQVTDLRARDGGIAARRLDAALPFFPPEAAGILNWSPILEELNDYRLKVTGLHTGMYEVRLDGAKIAEQTADELGRGVNLAQPALAAGPVAEQVKAVKAAIEAKNRYHHDRVFRGVVLANVSVPDWLDLKLPSDEIEAKRRAAYQDRMAKMPELDEAVRKALEMKPHSVEIIPVGN